MNDLSYGQLSIPNRSHTLALVCVIIKNSYNISITLDKNFIASHSLSQFSQMLRVYNPILTTQLPSKILCLI